MESLPAVQTQVRSHERKTRARRRGAAGAALPEVPGGEACSDCGTTVSRSELMYGPDGGQCTPCFSESEDRLAQGGRTWMREAGWTVTRAAGTLGVALASAWHVVAGAGGQVLVVSSWNEAPVGIEHGWGWIVLFSPLVVVGGTLSLQALRDVRTRWVLRHGPDGGSGAFVVHAISAALTLASTVLIAAITLLPLAG